MVAFCIRLMVKLFFDGCNIPHTTREMYNLHHLLKSNVQGAGKINIKRFFWKLIFYVNIIGHVANNNNKGALIYK